MERGCQTLAEMLHIFQGCEFALRDAKIVWQDSFDIDVAASIRCSGSQNFNMTYDLSLVRPLGNQTTVVFRDVELTFNHYEPTSTVQIRPRSSAPGPKPQFTISPEKKWAVTYTQAYYLKWKTFLDKLDGAIPLDTRVETSLDTTRLITKIYARGGQVRGS